MGVEAGNVCYLFALTLFHVHTLQNTSTLSLNFDQLEHAYTSARTFALNLPRSVNINSLQYTHPHTRAQELATHKHI